jgi:hypothetical protein
MSRLFASRVLRAAQRSLKRTTNNLNSRPLFGPRLFGNAAMTTPSGLTEQGLPTYFADDHTTESTQPPALVYDHLLDLTIPGDTVSKQAVKRMIDHINKADQLLAESKALSSKGHATIAAEKAQQAFDTYALASDESLLVDITVHFMIGYTDLIKAGKTQAKELGAEPTTRPGLDL